MFAVAFEDEEEKDRNKTADTINGMVDSILFGLGFGGAIISTVKNVIRELDYQAGRKTPEYVSNLSLSVVVSVLLLVVCDLLDNLLLLFRILDFLLLFVGLICCCDEL